MVKARGDRAVAHRHARYGRPGTARWGRSGTVGPMASPRTGQRASWLGPDHKPNLSAADGFPRTRMDASESILTKLDVREFSGKRVPGEIRGKILEAARLTGSSMNSQHWRFILIQDRSNLERLAEDSTSGKWVATADFAILILVNPKIPGYTIDGGRALQEWSSPPGTSGSSPGSSQGSSRRRFEGTSPSRPTRDIGRPRIRLSTAEGPREEEQEADRGHRLLGEIRKPLRRKGP